jgi:hypothetical protein
MHSEVPRPFAANREGADQESDRVGLRDLLRVDVPKLQAAITQESIAASPVVRILFDLLKENRGPYQTRLLYCPSLPLLWNFSPGDGSAASVAHRAFARAVWRERGFSARLLVFASFLLWPPIVFGLSVWFTWLNGAAVREQAGKGIARQMYEQIRLAAGHGILPPWYYLFELFDDARRAKAGHYLKREETKGGLYRLLKSPGPKRLLNNKVRFAKRCRECGVATPHQLAARRGKVSGPDREAPVLPRSDLFVKPRKGQGGRGAESWSWDGTGWSREGSHSLSEAELLEHFEAISRVESYVIQPYLVNYADLVDLSCGVLSTVRMVTIRDGRGGYAATHAVLRMPKDSSAKVDNFHAGGIAAKVDIATGELGLATDMGVRPDTRWYERHPLSGALIQGRKLPFWDETVDLARRAHAAFSAWAVIGWDIAIVDSGPTMIEGNSGPDLDIIQRTHREPLGESRFGELLAVQIERAGLV